MSVAAIASVWDTKRQIIWVIAGLTLGTAVVYQDAYDEGGKFVASFFIFLEMLLVLIIAGLFYLYSRPRR